MFIVSCILCGFINRIIICCCLSVVMLIFSWYICLPCVLLFIFCRLFVTLYYIVAVATLRSVIVVLWIVHLSCFRNMALLLFCLLIGCAVVILSLLSLPCNCWQSVSWLLCCQCCYFPPCFCCVVLGFCCCILNIDISLFVFVVLCCAPLLFSHLASL